MGPTSAWFVQQLFSFDFLFCIPIVALFISVAFLFLFLYTGEWSWRARIGTWLLNGFLILYLIGSLGASVEHFLPPIHEMVRVTAREMEGIRNSRHSSGKTGTRYIVYVSSKNWDDYTDTSARLFVEVKRGDTLEVTARPWSKDWTRVSIQRTGEVVDVGTSARQFMLRIALWFVGLLFVAGPVFWVLRKKQSNISSQDRVES